MILQIPRTSPHARGPKCPHQGLAALKQPCWDLRRCRTYGDKVAHLPCQQGLF